MTVQQIVPTFLEQFFLFLNQLEWLNIFSFYTLATALQTRSNTHFPCYLPLFYVLYTNTLIETCKVNSITVNIDKETQAQGS